MARKGGEPSRLNAVPSLEGSGLGESDGGAAAREPRRRLGDYVAHRFSGSYQKAPFTLIEEVVDLEDDLWVVDYTFEQEDVQQTMRVRFEVASDRPVRVSHLRGGAELSAALEEYRELMARTSFAVDANEGSLGGSQETCLVGARELDCELSKFRVLLEDQGSDREATLLVTHSPLLARDVAGEIRAVDGTLLYRSELVELRLGEEGPRGTALRERSRGTAGITGE